MTTLKLFDNISRKTDVLPKLGYGLFWLALFVASLGAGQNAYAAIQCSQTITANVVVFDSPTMFNRLGAQNPNWITYALERDAVDKVTKMPCSQTACTAGNVELRRDKRPRPLVIRSVEGACLTVNFTNLLDPIANPNNPQQDNLFNNDQVASRCAGFHATGTELVSSMTDDGSMVGNNHPTADVLNNCGAGAVKGGLVGPNGSITYNLYTPHEGAYIINSYGATIGSEANSGNLAVGMFGALNVQPKGARIYRSQMTEEELRLATRGTVPSDCTGTMVPGVDCNPGGQPIIDYEATYPNVPPWIAEGKAGLPIINMLTPGGELVHSDINAIIAGPNADGTFPPSTYPLESVGKKNPQLPNRLEPFREFTSQYHDEQTNSQVFPQWYNNPVMTHVTHGVKDQFMINYGSGGIGSEIIANRLHTGPMHDCTGCAYEEFFLASQTVGDPALLVAMPANTGIEQCDPTAIGGPSCWRDPVNLANGPIPGNYALYQEDPSNVHHAYTGDFVKMRNTHAGSFEQHIFHFHNHQWIFNPNDDNGNYLDAQEIMPGSGHTYELVNGGAGNRNHTVGDAIFHCHFYPHFAQGMWYHMRNHDVLETGTVLAVSGGTAESPGFHKNPFDLQSGRPMAGSRALPDGELPDGSPIPAIVPLPGKPMPQMPADVSVMAVDRGSHSILGGRAGPDGQPDSSQAVVDRTSVAGADGVLHTADDLSPGYPFWLAGNECGIPTATDPCPQGIVGQRMPTPPLDMLTDKGARANAGNPNPPLCVREDKKTGDCIEWDATTGTDWSNLGGGWDGGLPRHAMLGYVSGSLSLDTQNRLDFRKIVEIAKPVYFPETGTDLEHVSMAYQAVRLRPSVANNMAGTGTTKGNFVLNGAPPVPGGPYNDPCIDDNGVSLKDGWVGNWYDGDDLERWTKMSVQGRSPYDAENPRTYKLANLQIDAVFNKVGHHYSQERIIILWEDVAPTIRKERPPEPLVMRFNTFDCGKILHANLVPHEFEVDDFQVRTPTDIIGQHIHLPKWDLTTNDGAANGWNYEDGTLAPGIVDERIHAINNYNKLAGRTLGVVAAAVELGFAGKVHPDVVAALSAANTTLDLTDQATVATIDTGDPGGTPAGLTHLTALPHPFFQHGGDGFGGQLYTGARTTIQRLLVDPVVNVAGIDRGLGLTFSHDHYGPSTFQQIGLYSTILAEPAGSTWVHNETGQPLGWVGDGSTNLDIDGWRDDGGPTSWQAAILTPKTAKFGSTVKSETVPNHREFYFEMSDFQHAYEPGVYIGADANGKPVPSVITHPSYFDATIATIEPNPATGDPQPLQNSWLQAVNPTLKLTANGGVTPGAFPDTVNAHPGCPGPAGQNDGFYPRPCPEAINIGHSSMWVVNYRNEPVGLRVFDPHKMGPDGREGSQAGGWNEKGEFINPQSGDLALAFQSRNDRAISALNEPLGCADGTCVDPTPAYPQAPYCQGTGDGINCDRDKGDPFTPIMRAYEGDQVKVKIQVGATEEQHQTTIHGVKWMSNGSGFGRSPNSGWRNFQSHGISEQFSLQVPIIPDRNQRGNRVDYLYAQDATRDGIWGGTWGILRSYSGGRSDLFQLPDSPQNGSIKFTNDNNFDGVCPRFVLDANGQVVDPPGKDRNIPITVKQFNVFAVKANDVLPNNLGVLIPSNVGGDSDGDAIGDNVGGPLNPAGGTLVYNRRGTEVKNVTIPGEQPGDPGVLFRGGFGPLNDPTALMYVLEEDLEPRWIEGVSPDDKGWDYDDYGNPIPGSGPGFSDGVDDRCQDVKDNGDVNPALHRAGCPVKLKANVPVEPLILRANAGDCIEVTLYNKLVDQATTADGSLVYVGSPTGTPVFDDVLALKGNLVDEYGNSVAYNDVVFDTIPDLAGWQDTFWVVNRDMFKPIAERLDPAGDGSQPPQMRFFGNNLIAPSASAGLHAQLVEYDASRDDGAIVGQNAQALGVARPGAQHTYRWYAGHVDMEFVGMGGNRRNQSRDYVRHAFPVEFGGSNLLSADRVKQPQKGMFGALVIDPPGATVTEGTQVADGQMACEPATHPEGHPLEGQDVLDMFGNTRCAFEQVLVDPDGIPDSGDEVYVDGDPIVDPDGTRLTRAQVTVSAPSGDAGDGGTFRETILIAHKIANLRWADGRTIKNVGQAEFGVEGAEDSGHAGFNYGMEPAWFRFGLPPDVPSTGAGAGPKTYGGLPNAHAMYANGLVAGEPNAIPAIPGVSALGDPQTPVFRTTANAAADGAAYNTRMHVLNGASADRDSTYILHGHVWPRDPYVCTGAPGSEEDASLSADGSSIALQGRCDPWAIAPSNALGLNKQAKYMGGEEGMGHVFGHWPILFDAGGTNGVAGDYLFRDYAPNGNRNGMFGILRVE